MLRFRSLINKMLPSFVLGVAVIFLIQFNLSAQELSNPSMKAFLIYKFAQHIEWPQEEDIDTFRIGVYGQDPELMTDILLLESVALRDKPISIIHFTRFNEIIGTHLLYFTKDKNIEILRIANRIAGNNTLMVSDRSRNQKQMMINFLPLVENKIQFEINKANIINANLTINPDLLLLGGTEIDVAGLYKESQQALQRVMRQFAELSDSFKSKSKQIEQLNQEIQERNLEIEKQSKETEIQKELYEDQKLKLIQQQEVMDTHAAQLANVLREVDLKQQTLNAKIELITTQEEEINNQREEIENWNRVLEDRKVQISIQEKKIEEQKSQLSNFANRVARQRIFLFIIVAICFLIFFLGFFIYRGYKIKKNANREIEGKNLELQQRQDEIMAQSEKIQQANEEVVATNEALEEQKRELQFALENLKLTQSQLIQSEKMASVGLLTAGIAHELNNPINFVGGNVNPLRRDMDEVFLMIDEYDKIIKANKLEGEFSKVNALKEKMDYSFLTKEIINLLEGIEEGANRSSQIVKGLRSFSRLDEEKCQLYDIHEGIDSTLILLQNKIKNRIKIRKDYEDIGEIDCFPSKLNQVLMNILTNSIQAIEGKGEISIQTISSEIRVKIIIKDNGKGMSPEVKKHIFEPFFTTKDVGKGTGLGLSISYGIIEQHNGNIDVISEPGKGTEFIITLPRTQSNHN